MDTFEKEILKYKERLNELEFYKARTEVGLLFCFVFLSLVFISEFILHFIQIPADEFLPI